MQVTSENSAIKY